MTITRSMIHHPKRYPGYPTNGKMPTKWMVETNGDKRWRRVYDRCDTPRRGDIPAVFIPGFLDVDGYRDLTPGESKALGYDFHQARRGEEEGPKVFTLSP